jgi:hypothetical protein
MWCRKESVRDYFKRQYVCNSKVYPIEKLLNNKTDRMRKLTDTISGELPMSHWAEGVTLDS